MGYAPSKPETENKVNTNHTISKQKGGTCYAHASAHAIIETESRIFGRLPECHHVLVKEIKKKYGTSGGNTYKVLQQECAKRQLKCRSLTGSEEAWDIVEGKKRVIVASFYLNEGQWIEMGNFFKEYPDSVCEYCDVGEGYDGADNGGHAVAIIGTGGPTWSIDNKKYIRYWKIKNSWGRDWADKGHFRLSVEFPIRKYIDVYFRVCDLTQKDKNHFQMNKDIRKAVLSFKQQHPEATWYFSEENMKAGNVDTEVRKKYLKMLDELINEKVTMFYVEYDKVAVERMAWNHIMTEIGPGLSPCVCL